MTRTEQTAEFLDGQICRIEAGRKVRFRACRTSHGGKRVSPFLRDEKAAKEWIEKDARDRFTVR